MRTSAVCAGFFGGSTNVVSARLNSAAMACICPDDRPSALRTTPSGLPANCVVVKTSTVTKFTCMSFSDFSFLHCLVEPTPGAHARDPLEGNDAGKNSEQSSLKMLSVQFRLKRHHAADRLSALHQVERVVDFVQRHHMRDHRVNLDLALHVP